MKAPSAAGSWPVGIGAYGGWLFDLDGVLTKTAEVHAAAWKQAFAEFLDNVDGEPGADGVRNFLAARAIELPEGLDGDRPDARTVSGLGNRKNELVLKVLRVSGVQVYAGAVALVQALRALGSPVAVVSAS